MMNRSVFSKGMRLERIIHEVRRDYRSTKPVFMRFENSEGFKFSNACRNGETRDASNEMGHFYESFAISLYGGVFFSDRPEGIDFILDSGEVCRPDIIYLDDGDVSGVAEVKSCRNGMKLSLLDSQQKKYNCFDNLDIRFLFFKHRFPKQIHFYKESTAELFLELAKSTFCLISLPFSIMQKFDEISRIDNDMKNKLLIYAYRPDEPLYESCFCISSWTLNRFLFEPEKVVSDMGLESGRFNYARHQTPEGMNICGQEVPSILLLTLKDKAEVPF